MRLAEICVSEDHRREARAAKPSSGAVSHRRRRRDAALVLRGRRTEADEVTAGERNGGRAQRRASEAGGRDRVQQGLTLIRVPSSAPSQIWRMTPAAATSNTCMVKDCSLASTNALVSMIRTPTASASS
jgi:hypothetical protein